ncbi:MAG: hypothetical protein ABW032_08905 [Burkholderiaceae bacterium]
MAIPVDPHEHARARLPVKPFLHRTLAVTVVASLASLLWPASPSSSVVQAAEVGAAPTFTLAHSETTGTSAAVDLAHAQLVPADLKSALRDPETVVFDPFVGITPVAAPAPSAPMLAPPPPAPPPEPPSTRYRFFGRLDNVSGGYEVYLASGDRVVLAQAGVQLDDGFVVEAVSPTEVRLSHAGFDARSVIPVPADVGADPR